MRSFKRLGRGVGWGLVTLWGASIVAFALLFLLPRLKYGDDAATAVAITIAGNHYTKESLQGIIEKRGLNQSLPTQYFRFVGEICTNNLRSYRNDDRVMSAIARRLPATILLAACAVAVWLLVSIPIGMLTAKNAGQPIDRALLLLGLLAISVPTFWLGRLLQHYLGYKLGAFGVGGGAHLANLPLPALTLGIGGAAYYSRLFHANLRGVLGQEFVRAARARGLSERAVVGQHALKNALLPVVAVLGLDIASLLSGLVITEKIFAWPGIGSLAVDSVANSDLPMILGTVMWAALTVVVANLLVDFAYSLIDPRVRLD